MAQEIRARGREALGHPCHVGRWEDIDRLVDAAYERFGRVDILVNNAGMSPLYPRPDAITEEIVGAARYFASDASSFTTGTGTGG